MRNITAAKPPGASQQPAPGATRRQGPEAARAQLLALYEELAAHDGFGELRVEMRLLKRGQKEVILHCGKQYRFVIDHPA